MILKGAKIVGPNNIIEVEFDNDGILHRRSFVPGDDVSEEHQIVKDLALVNHTQDVIDAYRIRLGLD